MKRSGFRQRAPFILIENYDVQKTENTRLAWPEVISMLQAARPDKLHSFKIVVNFVREEEKK